MCNLDEKIDIIEKENKKLCVCELPHLCISFYFPVFSPQLMILYLSPQKIIIAYIKTILWLNT